MQNISEIEEIKAIPTFHQLAILCLDGSGSMEHINKIENISFHETVNKAVREFLSYFKTSSMVNNFSIAIITFDQEAKIHTPPTPLIDIDDYGDYNPLVGHGGGTDISNALELALELAKQHLSSPDANNFYYSASIAVLSDGMCQNANNTLSIGEELKKVDKVQLWCCHLINKEDYAEPSIVEARTVMNKIITNPNNYKTTYKADDLRKFFIASQSSL